MAFRGPNDDNGEPLRLSIPKRADYLDYRARLSETIGSLAAIFGKAPAELLRTIARINRDALCAKIIPAAGTELNSVGLGAAADYVVDLKNLMSYAATTEHNPRPYFGKASNAGSSFVDECRFGHTFRGSFGFVVETPPLPEAVSNAQAVRGPFARRVMERLAVGFDLVRQGVQSDDITVVSRNFRDGWNANICETVIRISGYASRTATEFSVAFGGIGEPAVARDTNLSPLVIDDRTVQYLESAVQTLRAAAVEQRRTFRGKITELRSNLALVEDADETAHTAIMRTSSGVRLRLRLPLEQYLIACDAHKERRDVLIDGIPEKVGKRTVLTEAGQLTVPA